MSTFNLINEGKRIPNNPGIYLMKDRTGKIIYIGKAKNLKNRINSYRNLNQKDTINNKDKNFWKTQILINKVQDIDFILTDNEV